MFLKKRALGAGLLSLCLSSLSLAASPLGNKAANMTMEKSSTLSPGKSIALA